MRPMSASGRVRTYFGVRLRPKADLESGLNVFIRGIQALIPHPFIFRARAASLSISYGRPGDVKEKVVATVVAIHLENRNLKLITLGKGVCSVTGIR